MHFIVEKKRYKLLKEICKHDIDVDIKDKLGRTPLHYACSYGDSKSLKILLASRANVNVKSIVKILKFYLFYNDLYLFNREEMCRL